MRTLTTILAAALLVSPLLAKRGVTPEDYFAFQFVSDPRLSPDGAQAAYVVTRIDQKQNRRMSSIWLAPVDGKQQPRALTSETLSSSSPRWSPDGKTLAFISTRTAPGETAKAQIYLLPMNGGEPKRLTNLKNGVNSFQWAPDGSRFVVVSRSGPSDAIPEANRKSDVRHYTTISYKFNDTGWFNDTRQHLWVVDAKTGKDQQITSGQDWDDTDPQWSPDGTRIAFVSDRSGKAYEDSRNTDIWVVPATGGDLIKISDHAEADNQPRWSPDGREIAFAGQEARRQHPKLFIASARGGSPSRLAVEGMDLIPTELTWSRDGKSLEFVAGVKGETHLFRVNLANRSLAAVTKGERAIRSYDASRTGQMVYVADDFQHLDDLYAADRDGNNERPLTSVNAALWSQLDLAPVERVRYESVDGLPIDGFLVKPVGWEPGKKYPLILSIHGGPAGMYGVDWFHEFQVYAGKGWAVFYCNPRGSTGYGEKFERGIVNNWGKNDYADVMQGVDVALKRYSWLDGEKMGVTGGSYGGFLTNWIVGHTNRFKAAVTLRSVVNFISDEGTRDGAYGHKDDFDGDLFEKFDAYWDASPLKYASQVKTPILILHSDNDYRVPLEQGEQWYRALKHFGATTELVIFPRENHNLTRTGEPKHLVESLNWQLYWFARYLIGDKNAQPPDA